MQEGVSLIRPWWIAVIGLSFVALALHALLADAEPSTAATPNPIPAENALPGTGPDA